MASLLNYLLSPDTPLWIKISALVLAIVLGGGSLVVWWTQDYWQNLNTPDQKSGKRQARPPF